MRRARWEGCRLFSSFARAPRWGRSRRTGSAENRDVLLKSGKERIPSGSGALSGPRGANPGTLLQVPGGIPELLRPRRAPPLSQPQTPSPFRPRFPRLAHCQACNWGNSSPPGPPRRRCPRSGRLPAPTLERAATAQRAQSPPPRTGARRVGCRGASGPGTASAHQLPPPSCEDPAPVRRRGRRAEGARASRVSPAEPRADPAAVGGAAGRPSPHLSRRRRRHQRQRGRGEPAEARPALRRKRRPAPGLGPSAPRSAAPWPRSCCCSSACSPACTRGKWRRGSASPEAPSLEVGRRGALSAGPGPRSAPLSVGRFVAQPAGGQARRRGEVGWHLTCPISPGQGHLPLLAGRLQPSLQPEIWGLRLMGSSPEAFRIWWF